MTAMEDTTPPPGSVDAARDGLALIRASMEGDKGGSEVLIANLSSPELTIKFLADMAARWARELDIDEAQIGSWQLDAGSS